MDHSMHLLAGKSRSRRAPEKDDVFPLDELNQDLLERVLSWLPSSSFFRLRAVCKRWTSVSTTATFQALCSQIPSRDPWYLMVDQDLDRSVVFDTSEGNWKSLNRPSFLHQPHCSKSIPVAASGGLVCFCSPSGDLNVCNPVTGACRELPPGDTQSLHAIAMNSSSKNRSLYRIVLVSGEFSGLTAKVFDSVTGKWEEEAMLLREAENSTEPGIAGEEAVYFLSKAGVVVSANTQRSPSKQYSSVLTVEDGEEVVYFLSHSGTVVSCNLARRSFFEYPRLLPIYSQYSIDVVECNGQMLVVILSEFLETASLRVWRFSKVDRSWSQVAVMPPAMSHEFFAKRADINCVGCGDTILICINSGQTSSYVMCNVVRSEWMELPKCVVNGRSKDFMSAFSFEPRVEACVPGFG